MRKLNIKNLRCIGVVICLLILASGTYLVFRFSLGIFAPQNYFTAKELLQANKISIIQLGELSPNFYKKQQLAKSYGFELVAGGCEISTEIEVGIKQHNKLMMEELERKYGKGCWSMLKGKLDSIDAIVVQ
ncbi:hypothetical protein DI53_3551 [Sphingobacterium deserti]|uniref:Uncharacterized protein n=2 Tax=Sphingobacterium deserti TaxID=1229276 RepID=A0A0B8SZ02_9SPHI|nr:hypothetical protein DI53_3551 [Sphingobacterium deserti]